MAYTKFMRGTPERLEEIRQMAEHTQWTPTVSDIREVLAELDATVAPEEVAAAFGLLEGIRMATDLAQDRLRTAINVLRVAVRRPWEEPPPTSRLLEAQAPTLSDAEVDRIAEKVVERISHEIRFNDLIPR